jgi:hypothetical protein
MMVTMMAMMGLGARGNNRDSQDDECNGSKKQRTQLHKFTLRQPLFQVVCY